MRKTEPKTKVVSVRLSPAILARIDELYEQYRTPLGAKITKAAFVTWIVQIGVDEVGHQLSPPKEIPSSLDSEIEAGVQ
jgi:hypothetical protein